MPNTIIPPLPSILLNSLAKQNIPYTPVWLMRQAGRYLPEYRRLREKAGSFLNLCKNPEFAAEITLQPLKRFNLDAGIIFSDILLLPEAMGMELDFIDGHGPQFLSAITTEADVDNLNVDEIIERLNYVSNAIKNTKSLLNPNIPLIGFSGSPFTLACYMIEGKASSNYLKAKAWLYNKPDLAHKLLTKLTTAIITFLNLQIKSGVDVIMLFDSWGGILTDTAYAEFSANYLRLIVNALDNVNNNKIPSIVFTKGGGCWLDKIITVGTDAISLDWMTNIKIAKKQVGNIVLQGNMDPSILVVGDRKIIKAEISRILTDYIEANAGSISKYIFNLGHGVLPQTNPDNVAYLVDTIHELSGKWKS